MSGSITSSGALNGQLPQSDTTIVYSAEEITAAHEKQWDDTTAMMAWTCPGFRHIWFKMLSQQHNSGGSKYSAVMTRRIPVAATDGDNLLLNPDTYFEYKLRERVYIGGHEVLHAVFDDVRLLHRCNASGKVPMNDGTTLPFANETMQISMDLRNNAILDDSNIGQRPKDAITGGKEVQGVKLPKCDGSESVLDIYQQVYKAFEKNGGQPGDGTVCIDIVLAPGNSTGKDPNTASNQRNPQQWAVVIQAAKTLEDMRAQGKMSGAMQKMFEQLLQPEISWLDHIETLILRATGSGSRSWKEPDPWFIGRDIYLPRKTGYGAGWIVIWGDTSGSRSDQEIENNMAELYGIMEDVNPKRLTVIWGDAEITDIDEIEDIADLEKVKARGVKGRGGTDIDPVMRWLADQMEEPELFIAFTDGYLTFPEHEPKFPMIWASSTDGVEYPYGQVVRVNKVPRA